MTDAGQVLLRQHRADDVTPVGMLMAADGKTAAKPIPAAPESSVTFRGAGANIVYIDWENDLLVVVRWIGDGLPEFIGKVLSAVQAPPRPTENGALR